MGDDGAGRIFKAYNYRVNESTTSGCKAIISDVE